MKGNISFSNIFNLTKNNPYAIQINEARKYEKGHPIYESIKHSLPAYSPNACFYGIRSLDTVKELTGYIYLDFDVMISPDFFASIPFIYASWLSFGGRGYGALVKTDGLTLDNFSEVWLYLEEYFYKNHSLKIDPQTKDYSRQNVITSDPNIYIKHNVVPLDVTTIDLSPYKTYSFDDFTSNPELDMFDLPEGYSSTILKGYQKIKYKTILDDYEGKPYVIIEEGKSHRNAYIPRLIKEGDRHKWLSCLAYTLIFNNKNIGYSTLEGILMKTNTQHCIPPLREHEIKQMVKSFMRRRSNNTLKIFAKKKRIWFNPESGLTLQEKRVIVGTENGKLRRKRTLKELNDIYNELTISFKKVTQEILKDHSGYSIRTIKNYWHNIIDGAE